jgi:hypothetical protein
MVAALPLVGAAMLAGWGLLTGRGPFHMVNSTHLEWTISLLGLGLGVSAISGLLQGRRIVICVSLMLLGMLVLSICPRPVPRDPAALPSYPGLYFGYPVRHGLVDHTPYNFPYFTVFSAGALLADFAIGGGVGLVLGLIAPFLWPDVPTRSTASNPASGTSSGPPGP